MRSRIHMIARILGVAALMGTGCAAWNKGYESGFMYKNLPVASGSASAGEGHAVTFEGQPLPLAGDGIKVGDRLRRAEVTAGDLSLVDPAEQSGQVRIISVVPSLDTKVCEQQTHYLSEKNNKLDTMAELITVSIDTPFAQSRFAKEAKIANVTFLSDYRGASFGKAHGLFLPGLHVLARAVIVVDKDNVIRYLQVTPELGQMPDMDAAFRAARELLHG